MAGSEQAYRQGKAALSYRSCPYCRPPQRDGGYYRYCSPEHALEARLEHRRAYARRLQERIPVGIHRAIQNTNAFFSRHNLSRRRAPHGSSELIPPSLLEKAPGTKAERLDVWLEENSRLRTLLAQNQEPHILMQVRKSASEIQDAIKVTNLKGTEADRLWISCEELLRDAGEETSKPNAMQRLLERGWRVVEFRSSEKNYLQLVAALLAQSNLYRSESRHPWDTNWRKAKELLIGAYNILQGPCLKSGQNDERTARLLHQVSLWELRLIAKDSSEPQGGNAKRALYAMQSLARNIDSPSVWLETHREEAGYFTYLYNRTGDFSYRELAEKSLHEAHRFMSTLPFLIPEYRLRMLRTEIEFFLTTRRYGDAIKRMEEFVTLWPQCPIMYYRRLIYRWQKDYALVLPNAVMSFPASYSAVLTFLYEDKSE